MLVGNPGESCKDYMVLGGVRHMDMGQYPTIAPDDQHKLYRISRKLRAHSPLRAVYASVGLTRTRR